MNAYPSHDIVAAASAATSVNAVNRNAPRALIEAVEPDSPAYDAGFEPGCFVTSVDGVPVHDLIDWRWLSAGDQITVGYIDLDGEAGEVELERDEGEQWGFAFAGVVFDGVRQCRNACTFCFMRQLPRGLRPSLSLRDDDFRLSFLAGTFVTLTNLTPEDEARIVAQRISPLRVSLHAASPQVRHALIGRHAQHGLDALDRLLAAGIQAHTQIVLVPGANDGDVLVETLEWAYAHPGILTVGIVPLGFTRHQSAFTHSFNDPARAREVLDTIEPFQRRARSERGFPWVFAADEFYRNAFGDEVLGNLPPAQDYGDFSMFEDGIGILRSCVDDWQAAQSGGLTAKCARALQQAGVRAYYLAGRALEQTFPLLIRESELDGLLIPLLADNVFFGGNVDVTGLLTGEDALRTVSQELGKHADGTSQALIVLPRVMFNDDGQTLDGWTLEDMRQTAKYPMSVVSCMPSEYLFEIAERAFERGSFQ